MELSNRKNKIYDPVREKWVENTPEEAIRQKLIKKMVEDLGFPLFLLAVEKELTTLPHLQIISSQEIPKRRADLIVMSKNLHPEFEFFPLLMIECKAVKLTPKFAGQVIGYNAFVKAPFVAIANDRHVLTGAFDENYGHFRFEKGLPHYNTLVSSFSKAHALVENDKLFDRGTFLS